LIGGRLQLISRANPRAYLEVVCARTSRLVARHGRGGAAEGRDDSDGFTSSPPLLLMDGGINLQRAGEEPAILRGVN
jgi:hypothetical protein